VAIQPKACVFIGFDRPELASKTLAPLLPLPKLYLFCDGATKENPKKQKIYRQIFEKVRRERNPLPTEIWTPPENFGPLQGPPAAFLWMLEKEKKGTIVEEDVLTTTDFHLSYSWALDAFENDPEVLAISSGLPQASDFLHHPFVKTPLLLVWGWATWYEKIKKIPIPCAPPPLPKTLSLLETLHYNRLKKTLLANPQYAWSPYIQLTLLAQKKQVLFPQNKTTQNLGIHPQARRSRGTPDTSPEPLLWSPTDTLPPFCPNLPPHHHHQLFKQKNGGLFQEIRTRLALRTKTKKIWTSLANLTKKKP
jgi:hypothetical protein